MILTLENFGWRFRRLRGVVTLRARMAGILRGWLWTLPAAAALLFASRSLGWPHPTAGAAAILAAGGLAGALLARVPSAVRAAVILDHAAGTDEILSTAVEFAAVDNHPFTPALLARLEPAWPRLSSAETFRKIGIPIPRLLPAAAALLILAVLVPPLPAGTFTRRPEPAPPVALNKIARLEKQARALRRAAAQFPQNRGIRPVAREMERLAEQLKKGDWEPREALSKMAALQDEIRKLEKESADSRARAADPAASKEIKDLIAEAREALESSPRNEEQKQRLEEALKNLEAKLPGAAGRLAEAKGDPQKMSEALEKLIEGLDEMEAEDLPPFEEAMEDLEELEDALTRREDAEEAELCPD